MRTLTLFFALAGALSTSAAAGGKSATPRPTPQPRVAPAAPAPIAPKIDALRAAVDARFDAALNPVAPLEEAARFAADGVDLLQGRTPASVSGAVAVSESASGFDAEFGYESFSLGFASRFSDAFAPGPQVPAPAAKAPRTISGRFSYAWRRASLGLIARLWGIEASLPVAGEALLARALDEAAEKRVVFMDFDRTLGPHAGAPTPGNAAALGAVKRAGKQSVIISDRPVLDDGRNNRSLQASLAGLPAEDLDGMLVAGKQDGTIIRYDAAKMPQVLHVEEGFSEEQKAKIREVARVFSARLKSLGVEPHDASGGIPAESFGKFSFAIMLKAGTLETKVLEAAEALEAAIKSRGLNFKVEGRMAYDAGKPPYLTFSKIDKSWATRKIADILKIGAEDAVIIGDSMFAPVVPKGLGVFGRWVLRLARALSLQPEQKSGNNTDEAMERGLPGALTFGVGGTAAPRLKNGYAVLGTVDATERILRAVASRPAAPAARRERTLPVLLAALALIVAGVLGWYLMITAFAEVFALGEAVLRAGPEIDIFWDR